MTTAADNILRLGRHFAQIAVDSLFPRDCAACAQVLAGPGPFCPTCSELTLEIDRVHCPRCGLPGVHDKKSCPDCADLADPDDNKKMSFIRARALYVYGAVVEQALRRCKFSGAAHIAQMVGQHMGKALAGNRLELDADFDFVVPIPVGTGRLRTRGFDQAVLMAQALGTAARKQVRPHVLRRQRETAAQATQSRQKRRENIHNAFVCAQPAQVRNKKILIIDDVMTTGMTAQAAARALLLADAAQVEVLTFARAVLDYDFAPQQVRQ